MAQKALCGVAAACGAGNDNRIDARSHPAAWCPDGHGRRCGYRCNPAGFRTLLARQLFIVGDEDAINGSQRAPVGNLRVFDVCPLDTVIVHLRHLPERGDAH